MSGLLERSRWKCGH